MLLAALGAVTVLRYWSRQGDPRFYAFLDTRVGAACASVFGWWQSPLERPVPDKADARLTAAEREMKAALQRDLDRWAASRPGGGGPGYRVRYRDLAFRAEYAGVPLHLDPPYAVVSELDAGEVEWILREVRDVYAAFCSTFAPLLARAPGGDLIHLRCFASEAAFREYQRTVAVELENTSGFYSPFVNRLVLYHDPAVDDTLARLTLRHEAAHQLFFAFGIHSPHRAENEWLIEGLASYCEPPRLGDADPGQVALLRSARNAGRLIPVAGLVNHRDERGLLACEPAELAYAQAWGLVHLLMQPAHRDAFFDYVRFLRAPASFPRVRDTERVLLLGEHLGLDPAGLQAAWDDHLDRLAAAP